MGEGECEDAVGEWVRGTECMAVRRLSGTEARLFFRAGSINIRIIGIHSSRFIAQIHGF